MPEPNGANPVQRQSSASAAADPAPGDAVARCIPSPVGGLPVGTRIQDYCIKGVVGEGGFAIVYLADDVLLHREVAIKEYMPAALAVRSTGRSVEPRSASHGETFVKGMHSFINEARMLAKFKHPSLIDVLRFWEENGTAYMAMPYYRGKTLRDIFRQSAFRCDEAWLRRVIEPILSGLGTMHADNCFHRDISTDNIMVLDGGNPVLLDFGAARRIVAAPDQLATIILKPGFAPIEQYSDDVGASPQGPWTDIYALSAVCYFAICGRMPTTSVARIIRDPVVPLAQLEPPGFGRAFLSAIDRGLAVRPEERPQTIAEFVELLDRPEAAALIKSDAYVPIGRERQRLEPVGPVEPVAAPPVDEIVPVPIDIAANDVTVPAGDPVGPSVPMPPVVGRNALPMLVGVGIALCLFGALVYVAMSYRSPASAGAADVKVAAATASPAPAAPEVAPPPVSPATQVRQPKADERPPPVAGGEPPPPAVARATSGAAPGAPPGIAPRAEPAGAQPRSVRPPQPPAGDRPGGPPQPAAVVAGGEPMARPASAGNPASKGAVEIHVKPWGMVTIDGRAFGVAPPLRRIWLAVGKHTVVFSHPQGANHVAEIVVSESGVTHVSHDFAALPAKPL